MELRETPHPEPHPQNPTQPYEPRLDLNSKHGEQAVLSGSRLLVVVGLLGQKVAS